MSKGRKTNAKRGAEAPAPNTQDGAQDGTPTSKPKKTRKSGGDRPSTFTQALGAEICARLINGERLDQICQSAHMPKARETVWRWRQANPAFNASYLEARVDQADAIADEILQIAETEQDIARGRLKIEARRVVLTRLNRTYGAAAAKPDEKPFSVAEALAEGRKRLDALIAEVGHERATRIRDDKIIEDACDPNPEIPERILRAHQRHALHVLEERKRALLAIPQPENPI